MVGRYLQKVWICSILLAPAVMILMFVFFYGSSWNSGFIGFYMLAVFAAVLFCLPTIFLYRLALIEMASAFGAEWKLKAILSLIAVCLLGFTYLVLKSWAGIDTDKDTITALVIFQLVVVTSTFAFRLRR